MTTLSTPNLSEPSTRTLSDNELPVISTLEEIKEQRQPIYEVLQVK